MHWQPRAMLLAVGAGIGLLLLELTTAPTQVGERMLMYARGFWVLSLILLFSMILAHYVVRTPGDKKIVVATTFMIMLYGLDPYSYGYRGGHSSLQSEFMWQRWATMAALLLLLISIVLQYRYRVVAAGLLGAETLGFLGANSLYLHRDGASVRFFAGEFSSPMPLLVVISGAVMRAYALWRAFSIASDREKQGA